MYLQFQNKITRKEKDKDALSSECMINDTLQGTIFLKDPKMAIIEQCIRENKTSNLSEAFYGKNPLLNRVEELINKMYLKYKKVRGLR